MVVRAARDARDICATEEAELHRLESGPGGVAQAEEGDGSGASATAGPAAGSHREGGQGSAEAAAAASDSSRSGMTEEQQRQQQQQAAEATQSDDGCATAGATPSCPQPPAFCASRRGEIMEVAAAVRKKRDSMAGIATYKTTWANYSTWHFRRWMIDQNDAHNQR